jgi:predicted PurR-regulated permease PerM
MRVPPVPSALDRLAGWSWRLLLVIAVALGLLALLWSVRVIVLPSIIAVTIAPALTPIVTRLRRRGIVRPAPAIALAVGVLVVGGLIAIVTTSVVGQWDELVEAVRRAVDEIVALLEGEPFNLSVSGSQDLASSLGSVWNEASGYLVSGARAGLGFVTGLVLAVTLLYFILRDGEDFWAWVLRRVTPENRAAFDRAGTRGWAALGGYVRGTALIAAIDATLIGIGLWILGVPLAFPLAVLIFLGAFIPFVGATISGLVAVLVAYADEGWKVAVIALAIVIGVQFVEGNFLQPVIQSRTVDLHPAVILLSVAAGASLFGILGAYLAVPVTAVAFAVIASLHDDTVAPAAPRPG